LVSDWLFSYMVTLFSTVRYAGGLRVRILRSFIDFPFRLEFVLIW